MELLKVENSEITLEKTAIELMKEYIRAKARTAEIEDIIRPALLDAMAQNGVKKYQNEFIRITYIGESKRSTFDSKALKVFREDIYNEYMKTFSVKASVKIEIL